MSTQGDRCGTIRTATKRLLMCMKWKIECSSCQFCTQLSFYSCVYLLAAAAQRHMPAAGALVPVL